VFYASAIYAVETCLSVCPSICLSHSCIVSNEGSTFAPAGHSPPRHVALYRLNFVLCTIVAKRYTVSSNFRKNVINFIQFGANVWGNCRRVAKYPRVNVRRALDRRHMCSEGDSPWEEGGANALQTP